MRTAAKQQRACQQRRRRDVLRKFIHFSVDKMSGRASGQREDYSWESRCSIWSDAETALLLIS